MKIQSPNGVVVTPFKQISVETTKTKSGVVLAQVLELVGLEVLYPHRSGDFAAGDRIFVPGNQYASAWGKAKYLFQGRECIVVPVTEIVLVEKAG